MTGISSRAAGDARLKPDVRSPTTTVTETEREGLIRIRSLRRYGGWIPIVGLGLALLATLTRNGILPIVVFGLIACIGGVLNTWHAFVRCPRCGSPFIALRVSVGLRATLLANSANSAPRSPQLIARVRPWKYREESTTSNEQVAETKGVTVKLLATVDLGPEIEGMAGRQLRMRMVTIEPGGVFGPIHDHKDRPGTVYILQGTITDQRNGVATDYGPGVGWPEDRNTTHWLENRGTIPAVEISVDIVSAG